MTTTKTAVGNSQDDNAKKAVDQQIESSESEGIEMDILDRRFNSKRAQVGDVSP